MVITLLLSVLQYDYGYTPSNLLLIGVIDLCLEKGRSVNKLDLI